MRRITASNVVLPHPFSPVRSHTPVPGISKSSESIPRPRFLISIPVARGSSSPGNAGLAGFEMRQRVLGAYAAASSSAISSSSNSMSRSVSWRSPPRRSGTTGGLHPVPRGAAFATISDRARLHACVEDGDASKTVVAQIDHPRARLRWDRRRSSSSGTEWLGPYAFLLAASILRSTWGWNTEEGRCQALGDRPEQPTLLRFERRSRTLDSGVLLTIGSAGCGTSLSGDCRRDGPSILRNHACGKMWGYRSGR